MAKTYKLSPQTFARLHNKKVSSAAESAKKTSRLAIAWFLWNAMGELNISIKVAMTVYGISFAYLCFGITQVSILHLGVELFALTALATLVKYICSRFSSWLENSFFSVAEVTFNRFLANDFILGFKVNPSIRVQ